MIDSAYRIRAMSRHELDMAVGWAMAEGWNPGRHDADIYFPADPLGFIVGVLGDVPVATVSAVRYGQDYGFIGFYIVAKERRGQGYGMRLWRAAMARLADVACVGLDGVLQEEASYRRSGFATQYRNRRYGGRPAPGGAGATIDARDVPFRLIVELDRRMFPARRDGFLAQWIAAPGHHARAIVADGRLAGFGVARPAVDGFKIAPLYAADRETAGRILYALCGAIGAGPVFLDVPEVNKDAVRLAESLGWSAAFETVRMYRGPAPAVDLAHLYGVTSFELG